MQVVDITDEHMHFVAACTHIDDLNEEINSILWVRESWLRDTISKGLKVKVAIDAGKPVGFSHCLPIELGTWGMSGKDLMTIPCLTLNYERVYKQESGSGYGRILVQAVEAEAKKEIHILFYLPILRKIGAILAPIRATSQIYSSLLVFLNS